MEFNLSTALIAGFVGTLAMAGLMHIGKRMGMTRMPPMPLILGAMATDDASTAKRIGAFAHFIVMGALIFGTVYAALFAAFGTASWLAGLLIGFVHGLAVGGIGFPMVGNTHPRMESVAAFGGDEVVQARQDELRVARPGPFGLNYGEKTPAGVTMAHMVYGLVVALVYTALL